MQTGTTFARFGPALLAVAALALAACGPRPELMPIPTAGLPGETQYDALGHPCDTSTKSDPSWDFDGLSWWSCVDIDETTNTATVKFKVAYEPVTLSLVAYKAPGSEFDAAQAEEQKVYASKTQAFQPMTAGQLADPYYFYSMTVYVPDCYFQVDFVVGGVLAKLGPAGSNNFYQAQQRLVTHEEGGTYPCTPQGCTPGYWKNHLSAWGVTGYAPGNDFYTVFGVNVTGNYTLLAALDLGGGGVNALKRHAVAALLSSAHPSVFYPYSTTEVLAMVKAAILSNSASTIEATKNLLDAANNSGCPL